MAIFSLVMALFAVGSIVVPARAAQYYSQQTNFEESTIPPANYSWDQQKIRACIYKDPDVPNPYYVWTKLAVQKWRQALREYTHNQDQWSFTATHVDSKLALEFCDVKVYILKTYKDFPGYPAQTGAYTSVRNDNGVLDAQVYLSPFVLHGDGVTELDLPSYAFRNSATHEMGHVLGLGHMKSQKGYLMSPQFDFVEEKHEYPITTLEMKALVGIYGDDGFGR